MANVTGTMTSHNLPNFAGMLFNHGNTRTPFSTLIGGKDKTAKSFRFIMGQEYSSGGGTSQPAITEKASLTAPNPDFVSRTQKTNCCQIFHEALGISYGKMSDMGQLSGLNLAGQTANPNSELDFQTAQKMIKIGRDIEYTFVNGSYQDGADDETAYKTRGLLEAVVTNVMAANNAGLSYWMVAEMLRQMNADNADTSNLTLMTNPVHIMQINADASNNGLTIVDNGREVNGLKLRTLMTPFGDIGLLSNGIVPAGTATFVNPAMCAPVYLPVPGKGNFFRELLAKEGASEKYQIYGQAGLDYGMEWGHGKITGLATTFTAPTYSRKVYVAGGTLTTSTEAAG